MPPGTIMVESLTAPPTVNASGTPARVRDRERPQTKWWLWPHLLSLDAPLVAVVWQGWWARSAGGRLSWAQEAILGGGVWLIYLADRLADTAAAAPGGHETARHVFYRRHQRGMRLLAVTVFLVLAGLAPWTLDARQFVAGLGLLALAGGYFWLVHRRADGGWARILPKEALVGAMFAAGTLFFVLGRVDVSRSETLLSGGVFGGLCFFNCALITKWERKPSDLRDVTSLLNAFPWITAHLGAGCVCLALLAGIGGSLGHTHGGVILPVIVSAMLLAALDRCRDRFSIDALRVLADAALLTPWLCQIFKLHL